MKNNRIFSLFFVLLITLSAQISAKGAGIVPYCTHKKGEVYFLLGEDHHRRNVWTDFGGACDQGETFVDTAAREGHEETMGVFSGTWRNPKKDTKKGTAYFKNLINQAKQCQSAKNDYKTYFVDVTNRVKEIKKTDKAVSGRAAVIQRLYKTRNQIITKKKRGWKCFKEKVNFKWVTFDELKNNTVPLYKYFLLSLQNSQFGKSTYNLNKSSF